MKSRTRPRHVLTIAGSDSGGGAGVQADLKTMLAHGVFGMSVVTSITAQSPSRVTAVHPVPVDVLRAQLDVVFDDLPIDAVKVGMLGTAEHVLAVAEILGRRAHGTPLVVDPVMVSSSGHRLLDVAAERALRSELIPLASLITPNLAEATALAGAKPVHDWARDSDVPVLITDGDGDGDDVIDVLWHHGASHRIIGARVPGPSRHGTGCSLASAVASRLAHGEGMEEAVVGAIGWVQALVAASPGEQLLHGLTAPSGYTVGGRTARKALDEIADTLAPRRRTTLTPTNA